MKSVSNGMLYALIILALCSSQTNATYGTFEAPAWWLCPYCFCEPEAPDDGDNTARPLQSIIDGNTHEKQALDSVPAGSSSTTKEHGMMLHVLREQDDGLPQISEIVALLRCIANDEMCPVCHKKFTIQEKTTTAHCRGKHVFHEDCMAQVPRCPICRDSQYFQREPICQMCRVQTVQRRKLKAANFCIGKRKLEIDT